MFNYFVQIFFISSSPLIECQELNQIFYYVYVSDDESSLVDFLPHVQHFFSI